MFLSVSMAGVDPKCIFLLRSQYNDKMMTSQNNFPQNRFLIRAFEVPYCTLLVSAGSCGWNKRLLLWPWYTFSELLQLQVLGNITSYF